MIPGWQLFVDALKWVLVEINQGVNNPGLAIIFFTVLVKLATLPLTLKSVRSMREMQRVQPLLKEVSKRFKDDKAKQQAETMRIYKEHGVNPAGGCLPMVIQLPIFFALYQALTQLVGVNVGPGGPAPDPAFHAAFLWVPSLAGPDPYYIWPVLSAAFQFLGNRMSQPYGSNKNMDPQQAMTQRMMQFMPVIMIVFYLKFASGAVIYWTFSAIFSAVQTYFINGFGTLPDVPGLTWLPKRPLPAPTPQILEEVAEIDSRAEVDKRPLKPATTQAAAYRLAQSRQLSGDSTGNGSRRKGFMEKMMEQALAAQEAQQAARSTAGDAVSPQPASETVVTPVAERAGNGSRTRVKPNGNSVAPELADLGATGATLPAKRRGKR